MVDAAELLFSSFGSVGSLTVATFVIMVFGCVLGSIITTRAKKSSPLAAKLLFAQSIEPVAPGEGVVQAHPAGDVNETNVVPDGITSFKAALFAVFGPLLTTSMV